MKARVVSVGGLTLLPKGGRPTYQQVLERSLASTSFLRPAWALVVSGRNDVYGAADSEELYAAVARVAESLASRRMPSVIIFGLSSATWKYRGRRAQEFDARVGRVLAAVRERMVPVSEGGFCLINSGRYELQWKVTQRDIRDGIGHLRGRIAFEKLAGAIAKWVLYSLRVRSRLKLTRGA